MTIPALDGHLEDIRLNFAPALRKLGFKGSGQNFVRVCGETINALNVQGSKNGDGCFLNLGLHFSFLPPCWTETIDEARKWKEIDCEFRWRLRNEKDPDGMWRYGVSAAAEMLDGYMSRGETQFRAVPNAAAMASLITYESLADGRRSDVPWGTTRIRQALAMARIWKHLGSAEEAKRFAQLGLTDSAGATLLQRPLKELAGAT